MSAARPGRNDRRDDRGFQRNALAPSLLAAAALFVAPALLENEWFLAIRFTVAILALIMAWFAVQAGQWWWLLMLIPVAIVWNPIFPLPLAGPVWVAAQPIAAVAVLVAGALIRTPRP
jgi:hypothetical protein